MKRVFLAVVILTVSFVVAKTAQADAGLLGQNVQVLDASLNMRRSTTEQIDPIRGQSVLMRPRPDFDPVPIPVGSFQLFPAINVGTYYDSNIFALQNNEERDLVWKINPTMSFLSNWGRHALGFTGLADIDYYTVDDKQNYAGGAMQAEGRYDISEQMWLSGVGGYQRVTELKGSPADQGNAAGPSQYDLYSAGAQFYRGVGLLKTTVNYNFGYYEYSPVEIIGGGTASQSARDRTQNKVDGEVRYDVTENLKPFIRGAYNWRDYTTTSSHSSNGYNIDVGAAMDFGGITTAEAYIGYMSQDYYNFMSGVVDAIDFGGNLLWNVTPLTSVEFRARRSIEETTVGSASSFLASEGQMILSHELRRDIVLQSRVIYDGLDYNEIERHDDLYDVGVGARYYMNRNFYGDFTYDFQRRTTDAAGLNYDRHIAFLRFGAQY
ncbi:MAG: outer membrane beta-barrel protein [Alphaproteobacteria bacterium]|nr:outer membrane beta-barrel protein [Alphaproteobacteria bacterium]